LHAIVSRQLELMNQQLALIAAQAMMVKQTAVQIKNEKVSDEKAVSSNLDNSAKNTSEKTNSIQELEHLQIKIRYREWSNGKRREN